MVYGTCLTLNIASEAGGVGAAVLIRALEPTEGIELMLRNRPTIAARDLARGPGRVCAALGIGARTVGRGSVHERARCGSSAHRGAIADIQVSTRIGLSRDQHRRLRFLERGSPFVSVPP